MSWSIEGRPLRSVLVTRLRYLGDIVMATALLDILKLGDPALRLGFLCESEYAPVLRAHPLLQRLHVVTTNRSGSDARARAVSADRGETALRQHGSWATIAELRRCRYDLAVDLFFNPRSAWLVRLAGCRWRIGGTRSWRRHLYTHTALPPSHDRHRRFWELAPGAMGDHLCRLSPLWHEPSGLPFLGWFEGQRNSLRPRPQVQLPFRADSRAAEALGRLGLAAHSPYLLLAPGATWPTKEWPATHWLELIRQLRQRMSLPLVVLSPPARLDRYKPLQSSLGPRPGGLLPPLDLSDALEVTAGAALVVSVDGGIMHAAIGLGRPTVALFGPTNPDQWFPYRGLGSFGVLATRPDCHPCDLHDCPAFICLPSLSAATVADAVVQLLESEKSVR